LILLIIDYESKKKDLTADIVFRLKLSRKPLD